MFWLPEYGIGYVLLVNSLSYKHWFIASDLIDENLVQKSKSFEIPSVEYQAWQPLDPNTFTPFKPAWKKYVGTYRFFMSGSKPSILMRIVLALGLTTNYTHLKVIEQDGYLYVYTAGVHDNDSSRLDEHLSGLFFTPTGECLDLRGPTPTWRNFRIKKVDNDNDGNFDPNFQAIEFKSKETID